MKILKIDEMEKLPDGWRWNLDPRFPENRGKGWQTVFKGEERRAMKMLCPTKKDFLELIGAKKNLRNDK